MSTTNTQEDMAIVPIVISRRAVHHVSVGLSLRRDSLKRTPHGGDARRDRLVRIVTAVLFCRHEHADRGNPRGSGGSNLVRPGRSDASDREHREPHSMTDAPERPGTRRRVTRRLACRRVHGSENQIVRTARLFGGPGFNNTVYGTTDDEA